MDTLGFVLRSAFIVCPQCGRESIRFFKNCEENSDCELYASKAFRMTSGMMISFLCVCRFVPKQCYIYYGVRRNERGTPPPDTCLPFRVGFLGNSGMTRKSTFLAIPVFSMALRGYVHYLKIYVTIYSHSGAYRAKMFENTILSRHTQKCLKICPIYTLRK